MRVSEIENLYLRTDFRELHTSSVCNNALHDFILMKLIFARFAGIGGSLITYSNDQNKQIAN